MLWVLRRIFPQKSPSFLQRSPVLAKKGALYFREKALSYTQRKWTLKGDVVFKANNSAKEHLFPAKEPYISAKEPCICKKELRISAKEPYLYLIRGNEESQVLQYFRRNIFRKRALYFRKKDLYFRKRALYFRERALHFPQDPYISGESLVVYLEEMRSRRCYNFWGLIQQKSTIFPQKSFMFPPKNPIFPGKVLSYTQRKWGVEGDVIYEDILNKSDLCLRKRALYSWKESYRIPRGIEELEVLWVFLETVHVPCVSWASPVCICDYRSLLTFSFVKI